MLCFPRRDISRQGGGKVEIMDPEKDLFSNVSTLVQTGSQYKDISILGVCCLAMTQVTKKRNPDK